MNAILVRAQLYPIKRNISSFQCKGKWCQTCLNVKETEALTSSTTDETFEINYNFNWNHKYLVYLITCNVFSKQYVVRQSMNLDLDRLIIKTVIVIIKSQLDRCICSSIFVSNFLTRDSFSDDLSVTLINKTVLPNLLKQENYWRNTVKTMTPEGLNIEV